MDQKKTRPYIYIDDKDHIVSKGRHGETFADTLRRELEDKRNIIGYVKLLISGKEGNKWGKEEALNHILTMLMLEGKTDNET